MIDPVALALLVSGIVLFMVGDVLWLVQVTMSRQMNLRVTGGLVLAGVMLIAVGVLLLTGTS